MNFHNHKSEEFKQTLEHKLKFNCNLFIFIGLVIDSLCLNALHMVKTILNHVNFHFAVPSN